MSDTVADTFVPLVEFVVDCPACGEPASNGNTLFTDYEPGKPLRIDLEMAAAQETFTCTSPDCGAECITGDLDVSDVDEFSLDAPEVGAPDA